MKKITVLTMGLLSAGLLGACSNQKMESEASTNDKSSMTTKKDSYQSSKMAKDFSLQGVDGKTYKLSDIKVKKVYLKFLASWCSICLSTLGDTNDLAK
ncbi:peroxiredoxin family protein, partial [Streptococcus gordonii]|uniref:peroxiredoxin family protein n=1 Tax=Streptococcus gordonii TaxID=1302 RepID=UPI0023B11984